MEVTWVITANCEWCQTIIKADKNDPKADICQFLFFNIAGFITDKIQELASNPLFDYDEEEKAFKITFKTLNQTTKEDTFRKYDPRTDRFSRGFLSAPFEVIATGIGYNYKKYELSIAAGKIDELDIKGKLKKMWENEDYQNAYGRGKDAKTRVPKLIPLGRELFNQWVRFALFTI